MACKVVPYLLYFSVHLPSFQPYLNNFEVFGIWKITSALLKKIVIRISREWQIKLALIYMIYMNVYVCIHYFIEYKYEEDWLQISNWYCLLVDTETTPRIE